MIMIKNSHIHVSWKSLLKYLNAKFPLEFVYSGAHCTLSTQDKGPERNGHTYQHRGRQSAEVRFFCLFIYLFFITIIIIPRTIFFSQFLSIAIKKDRKTKPVDLTFVFFMFFLVFFSFFFLFFFFFFSPFPLSVLSCHVLLPEAK